MTGVRARLKRILGINPETPEPLGNQKKRGLTGFPKDPCPDPCGRPCGQPCGSRPRIPEIVHVGAKKKFQA